MSKKKHEPRPWSADDLSLLKDHYREGKGVPYIADKSGWTTAGSEP